MQDASFHLAADDGAEDFRADGALSTSAPKVKPRLLADVLWEAANERLYHPDGLWFGKSDYSCNAIAYALAGHDGCDYHDLPQHVFDFLFGLGCAVSQARLFGFERNEEAQGVRYMWLLLAMHVAEDEGITL